MLHFLIGTKAQFIKLAPLFIEMNKRREPYHVLNLGQHRAITHELRKSLDLNFSETDLLKNVSLVSSISGGLVWLLRCFMILLSSRKKILECYFNDKPGVVIVHGDTASTLVGALFAKRLKLPLVLVEAGLNSHRLFDPFPEEIIRRAVENFSDVLFAPNQAAYNRLLKKNNHGVEIYQTKYNTGLDLIKHYIQCGEARIDPQVRHGAIATFHRLETIVCRNKVGRNVDYLLDVAKEMPVAVFVHKPTLKALEKFNFLHKLTENENIKVCELIPHRDFIRKIAGAQLVITDGGSIQEECAFFHTPCVILRGATERPDGLGCSAFLTQGDYGSDKPKLQAMTMPKRDKIDHEMSATKAVLDKVKLHLLSLGMLIQ